MTSEFSPSDREYDPADAVFGAFSSGAFAEESALADACDHWIDEALRTVPLPAGFHTRMSLLAQSVQSGAPSGNPA